MLKLFCCGMIHVGVIYPFIPGLKYWNIDLNYSIGDII